MYSTFTLNRVGFNSTLKVGEVVDYKNEKYIVIRILDTKFRMRKEPIIEAEAILQKVGTYEKISDFERHFTFSEKLNTAKHDYGVIGLRKIGSTFKEYHERGNPIVLITGIESMSYSFIDLVVVYQAEIIQPWSREEMNKAIKDYRVSTFKIVTKDNEVAEDERD